MLFFYKRPVYKYQYLNYMSSLVFMVYANFIRSFEQ